MKKYFLHDGNAQSGPYDIDDLKTKSVTKQTPIWYEGLNDWTTAGAIAELNTLFVSTPPPFQQQKVYTEEEPKIGYTPSRYLALEKKKSPYRTLGIVISIFVFILVGKLIYTQIDHQNAVAARQNMINAEEDAKKVTRDNITSYVTAELSDYLYSNMGGIKNLSVIVNNNTAYIIDEVQVRLFYYKPNGEVWDTRIVIFNLLNPETKYTKKVADTNRGVKVKSEIILIKSRSLGL